VGILNSSACGMADGLGLLTYLCPKLRGSRILSSRARTSEEGHVAADGQI
jgi:hypothetical protein